MRVFPIQARRRTHEKSIIATDTRKRRTRLGIIKKKRRRRTKNKGEQQRESIASLAQHHQTYLDNIAIAVLSNPEDVGWWLRKRIALFFPSPNIPLENKGSTKRSEQKKRKSHLTARVSVGRLPFPRRTIKEWGKKSWHSYTKPSPSSLENGVGRKSPRFPFSTTPDDKTHLLRTDSCRVSQEPHINRQYGQEEKE